MVVRKAWSLHYCCLVFAATLGVITKFIKAGNEVKEGADQRFYRMV